MPPGNPDSLAASGDFDSYATIAAAEAATTAGTLGISREIYCHTAGTLVVKQANGGATKTLSFLAGGTKAVAITGIVAAGSSGCVPIEVLR